VALVPLGRLRLFEHVVGTAAPASGSPARSTGKPTG
jgi:hypothetical protein